jgi:hypothetical protein
MNLFDQAPLMLYVFVVLGLAVVGGAAALGAVADAVARSWRSKDV